MKSSLLILFTLLLVDRSYTRSAPSSLGNRRSSSAEPSLSDFGSRNNYRHDKNPALLAEEGQCQRIEISLCKGLGYNMTRMPNRFGHERQKEAELMLQTFNPLVQYNCSESLRFFLCSLHVPMCDSRHKFPIGMKESNVLTV